MIKKLKSKLLTKLFIDWVNEEFDNDLLEVSKIMIQNRQNFVNELAWQSNPPQSIGFKFNNQQ